MMPRGSACAPELQARPSGKSPKPKRHPGAHCAAGCWPPGSIHSRFLLKGRASRSVSRKIIVAEFGACRQEKRLRVKAGSHLTWRRRDRGGLPAFPRQNEKARRSGPFRLSFCACYCAGAGWAGGVCGCIAGGSAGAGAGAGAGSAGAGAGAGSAGAGAGVAGAAGAGVDSLAAGGSAGGASGPVRPNT